VYITKLTYSPFDEIILPVMLYSSETWSLTLWEERRLRVFENRILRRVFGPKKNENEEWCRLHNEELHNLCHSPNIVRVIKFRRLRLIGKPTGKRPSGRPRTILEWTLKK
jgi:hypothetical protein